MITETELDEYQDEIRNVVCSRCVERPPGGPPCAPLGKECGIEDTSAESASGFARSSAGEWSAVHGGGQGTDTLMVRLWHESNWMVDMHSALGQGMSSMHTGLMCFDADGRITQMIDRYMEMAQCSCVRLTSMTFGSDGRVTRREQRFVLLATGSEIQAPEVATKFPEAWDFRKLEQLPFYSLMKK